MPCPVSEEIEAKLESLRKDLKFYHPENGMSGLPARQARQAYEQTQSRIIWAQHDLYAHRGRCEICGESPNKF
jgi:hypothetical protein